MVEQHPSLSCRRDIYDWTSWREAQVFGWRRISTFIIAMMPNADPFWSTNHSGAAMEKVFSENIAAPLVRRLRDHCDCFAFEQGSDRSGTSAISKWFIAANESQRARHAKLRYLIQK
jgi:hypothetical protein